MLTSLTGPLGNGQLVVLPIVEQVTPMAANRFGEERRRPTRLFRLVPHEENGVLFFSLRRLHQSAIAAGYPMPERYILPGTAVAHQACSVMLYGYN